MRFEFIVDEHVKVSMLANLSCIQFVYKFRYSFIDILRIHYAEKSLKLFFAL